MISGQQALRFIDQAVGQIRGQESSFQAALAQAADQAARLRAERTQALRQFAAVRLDALARERLVSELAFAERKALETIAAGERAAEKRASERAALAARRESAAEERYAKADAYADELAALEDFQAGVEPGVRRSPEWIAANDALARARTVAEEADRKAGVAEADRDEKRKPYEADSLFMYLWKRGFGGSGYRANPLTRWLDGKVAALVRYQDARPNFAMLNEIPLRLREHAQRCAQAVEAERERIAEIELAALRTAGIAPFEARVERARAAAQAADAALAEIDAALARLDAEMAERPAEAIFEQAVDVLLKADAQQTVDGLYRAARQTRTRADDTIVDRVVEIDRAIARLEDEKRDLRKKAQEAAARRAATERERDSFRRRGWDSPYGEFRNEHVIGQVLGGLIKGGIQGAILGDVLRDNYRERRPRADSTFGGSGGFNLPFPRGGSGGGGWLGGGGGGGDGFNTGGSI
jgi:hypothetical protein